MPDRKTRFWGLVEIFTETATEREQSLRAIQEQMIQVSPLQDSAKGTFHEVMTRRLVPAEGLLKKYHLAQKLRIMGFTWPFYNRLGFPEGVSQLVSSVQQILNETHQNQTSNHMLK